MAQYRGCTFCLSGTAKLRRRFWAACLTEGQFQQVVGVWQRIFSNGVRRSMLPLLGSMLLTGADDLCTAEGPPMNRTDCIDAFYCGLLAGPSDDAMPIWFGLLDRDPCVGSDHRAVWVPPDSYQQLCRRFLRRFPDTSATSSEHSRLRRLVEHVHEYAAGYRDGPSALCLYLLRWYLHRRIYQSVPRWWCYGDGAALHKSVVVSEGHVVAWCAVLMPSISLVQ